MGRNLRERLLHDVSQTPIVAVGSQGCSGEATTSKQDRLQAESLQAEGASSLLDADSSEGCPEHRQQLEEDVSRGCAEEGRCYQRLAAVVRDLAANG